MSAVISQCDHMEGRWVAVAGYDYDGEPFPDEWREMSTCDDIGIGSYRCRQCGFVGYYTGGWRAHHEDGAKSPAAI